MFKQTLEYYITKVRANEEGATAVEYGVLIALIIAVLVVVIGLLGTEINTAFQSVLDAL